MNKEFEKYIKKVIEKYVPVLLLQRHTFEVEFGCKDKNALFECTFHYPYLNVSICYSEESIKKWLKKDNMIPFIVHELCHVITDPFYSKANYRYTGKEDLEDERENLTDHICNIALNK